MVRGVAWLVIVIWLTACLELHVSHISNLNVSECLLSSADLSFGCWTVLLWNGFRRGLSCRDEYVLLLLR
jgi:hypothetical protein